MPKSPLHESTLQYISTYQIARDYDRYFGDQELFKYDSKLLDRWFETPRRIIDFGCGTGRHVRQFARRGFTVIGLDLSESMLTEARANLDQAKLKAKLIRTNFCTLAPTNESGLFQKQSFDYAICMFSTLGLIYGKEHRLRFLQTIRQLLKPTGRLALHVHNFGYNIWRVEGCSFLLTNFFSSRLGRSETGDKFLNTYRGIKKMYIHVFTKSEITDLLHSAGFIVSDLIYLNRRRDGPLKSNFLHYFRANGFIIHARIPS